MPSDLDVVTVTGFETEAYPSGPASAASWPAIIAGAVVAAACSLLLLALGSGLGLASISPWTSAGPSPVTFTVTAAIWLIIMQWLSSGLGGYLAGRLRTRWYGTHTHEVFFRDTAHGLVTWALATVLVAGLLGSAVLVAGGATARAGADASAAAASSDATSPALHPFSYDADYLFRSARGDAPPVALDTRMEVERILGAGAASGGLSTSDTAYLTQLIMAHTGTTPGDALQRVQIVSDREQAAAARVKAAADSARKAAAALAMITALSMLIGALIASVAAALGGQQRDEHP